ncbi:hypothetical protein BofuT4_P119220.1 [Botrytis cinerea T4]|uniref:Transcription factor CBF/NF-Y/archaeal histone domain-containing protein n=1 Tax=Botryotinia fuckeliana (strain T4) TaxID=999810 RepID=G2Y157_BOTF4|nr:hypothetical protein BofuT4_P119220.1 [Botrytis cinerea T4]
MATGQKLYPRANLKKIVKAHSKRNLTKNVDVLIFLDYMLFLETLMKEAGINAKQAGERGISAKSIKKVTEILRTMDWTADGDAKSTQVPWHWGSTSMGKKIALDRCARLCISRSSGDKAKMTGRCVDFVLLLLLGPEFIPLPSSTFAKAGKVSTQASLLPSS